MEEVDKIVNGIDESCSDQNHSSPIAVNICSPVKEISSKVNVESPPTVNLESPSKISVESPSKVNVESPSKVNVESPSKLDKIETPLHNGCGGRIESPKENGDHKEAAVCPSSSVENLPSPIKPQHVESPSKKADVVNVADVVPLVPQQALSPQSLESKPKPVCSVEPTPSSPIAPSAADLIHRIKWFTWHGTKTPIITQNENGPCPLLAVMNVLLLRGQVNLPDELEVVTSQNLMERLGDCILRLTPTEFAQRPDYQQNISDAIAVLPKLMTGLDVNVKFNGVSEFEFTPECIVFDLLNIPLYHGWLVEPENQEARTVINSLSYNQLVEKIIDFKGSGDSVKVSEAIFAEQFLESSASQLTYHGLYELNQRLKDGELAVFFRNNHFSSLIKHEAGLFLLVTDQGFLNEKAVVWETLNNIEGDSKFLDAEFSAIPPKTEALVPLSESASPQEQIDHDLMVAMSLDDQERQAAPPVEVVEEYDRQLALQLQEEENRAGSSSQEASNAQERQNASSPTESSGKKKDKCNIL